MGDGRQERQQLQAGQGSLPGRLSLSCLCFATRRCGSANSCIFADVVPVALRSTVYAFDRSFEGAVGACAAPLVGALSVVANLS